MIRLWILVSALINHFRFGPNVFWIIQSRKMIFAQNGSSPHEAWTESDEYFKVLARFGWFEQWSFVALQLTHFLSVVFLVGRKSFCQLLSIRAIKQFIYEQNILWHPKIQKKRKKTRKWKWKNGHGSKRMLSVVNYEKRKQIINA